MANLFYIMGKSASGKDTIYKRIKEEIDIKEYVLYTTRPMREGEREGIDYHYVSDEQISKFKEEGKVIESRTYQTVKGPWTYATIADKQLKQNGDIITVGTLESYRKVREYFENRKDTKVLPIYITIDEQERRKRAIEREERQKNPNYAEVERRINADNIDFSEENLKLCGITPRETFENYDLEKCVGEILGYIEKAKSLKEKYNVERLTNIPSKSNRTNTDFEEER